MPTLIIRNVPADTIAALDRLADSQDRSRESYIRQLLAEHTKGERKMYHYSVTINPSTETDQSVLNFLAELEPDVAATFVDTDADGCQIWHMITGRNDLDAVLDANPLVISYEVSDSDSPQYAAYHDKAD